MAAASSCTSPGGTIMSPSRIEELTRNSLTLAKIGESARKGWRYPSIIERIHTGYPSSNRSMIAA